MLVSVGYVSASIKKLAVHFYEGPMVLQEKAPIYGNVETTSTSIQRGNEVQSQEAFSIQAEVFQSQ